MIQYNPSDLHICRATRSQSLICVLLGGPSKLVDLSFGNSRFLKAVAAIIIAMNAPRPPLVAAFFPGIVCTVHSDVILYAPVPHCHLLFRLAPVFSRLLRPHRWDPVCSRAALPPALQIGSCVLPYLSVVCPAANSPGTILRHGPIVDLLLCCDSKLREFVLLPSVCCCWYCHFPALAAWYCRSCVALRLQALREVTLGTPLYRVLS